LIGIPPIIGFELPAITTIEEATSILPNSHLGVLVPFGSVIENFHNIATTDRTDSSGLYHHLHVFLQNYTSEGEKGCIFRNDGILSVLSFLVGCTSSARDKNNFSTPQETRPDFTGLYNFVQLIIVEENDRNIEAAVADIMNKFRFINNYSMLITVMFGFAISRNNFRIYKFERNLQSELPRSSSLWFSRTLNSYSNRVECILASLNVGRVLKYYVMTPGLLIKADIPLGTWCDRNNKKQIKICYDFMIVKSTQDQSRLDALKTFYNATSQVPNLEKLYFGTGKSYRDGFHSGVVNGVRYLNIYLKPVGKTVSPSNPKELRTALLCILHCIKELHKLGYFHTDIRWPNVVKHGESWVLIDCYDFCAVNDRDRLLTTKAMRSAGAIEAREWCAMDDLMQVLRLATDDRYCCDTYDMFRPVWEVADTLTDCNLSVDDIIAIVENIVVN